MDSVIKWLEAAGLGYSGLISLGLLIVDAGRRLALKEGVDPEKLASLEAAAIARMSKQADEMLAGWEQLTK